MKVLVYPGPNAQSWDDVPDAKVIEPTAAVMRVKATTIYKSDLHTLKGYLPEVSAERIIEREAVGTVEAVKDAVTNLHVGDRVLVSCISASAGAALAGSPVSGSASTVMAGSSGPMATSDGSKA
jgi:alcohol dehydrogenase